MLCTSFLESLPPFSVQGSAQGVFCSVSFCSLSPGNRLPFPPALPQQSQQDLPDLLLSSLPNREFLSIKTQSFYGSGENAGPETPIPAERVPLGHTLGFLLLTFLFYSPFFCPPLALGLSSAQASARGSSWAWTALREELEKCSASPCLAHPVSSFSYAGQ